MKRGRPRLFKVCMDTMIGVRVTPDFADALYSIARRQQTDVSEITRQLLKNYVRQNRATLSENCIDDKKDALLTT